MDLRAFAFLAQQMRICTIRVSIRIVIIRFVLHEWLTVFGSDFVVASKAAAFELVGMVSRAVAFENVQRQAEPS